jgi:hypothetical protein
MTMNRLVYCIAALSLLASPAVAGSDDEIVAGTGCPPGTIFYKYKSGAACVKPTSEDYGGGQAKQTDVLVPEQSSGPSPFGGAKPYVQKRKGSFNR